VFPYGEPPSVPPQDVLLASDQNFASTFYAVHPASWPVKARHLASLTQQLGARPPVTWLITFLTTPGSLEHVLSSLLSNNLVAAASLRPLDLPSFLWLLSTGSSNAAALWLSPDARLRA
jgi:hypothetical protein